jgi:hypothetical protein
MTRAFADGLTPSVVHSIRHGATTPFAYVFHRDFSRIPILFGLSRAFSNISPAKEPYTEVTFTLNEYFAFVVTLGKNETLSQDDLIGKSVGCMLAIVAVCMAESNRIDFLSSLPDAEYWQIYMRIKKHTKLASVRLPRIPDCPELDLVEMLLEIKSRYLASASPSPSHTHKHTPTSSSLSPSLSSSSSSFSSSSSPRPAQPTKVSPWSSLRPPSQRTKVSSWSQRVSPDPVASSSSTCASPSPSSSSAPNRQLRSLTGCMGTPSAAKSHVLPGRPNGRGGEYTDPQIRGLVKKHLLRAGINAHPYHIKHAAVSKLYAKHLPPEQITQFLQQKVLSFTFFRHYVSNDLGRECGKVILDDFIQVHRYSVGVCRYYMF